MSKIELVPILGDITSYIWSTHPQPWVLNYGELKRAYIMSDGTISVEFEVKKNDVENTNDWSVAKGGFVLEVKDSRGVPVMENWMIFGKKNIINATMCLKETT